MLFRFNVVYLFILLAMTSCRVATACEDESRTDLRTVRMIYLVSSDRENNEPVFSRGAVVASYIYSGGAFEQHAGYDPIEWTERKTDSDERHSFTEKRRDREFIDLHDSSRGYSIRLQLIPCH